MSDQFNGVSGEFSSDPDTFAPLHPSWNGASAERERGLGVDDV